MLAQIFNFIGGWNSHVKAFQGYSEMFMEVFMEVTWFCGDLSYSLRSLPG